MNTVSTIKLEKEIEVTAKDVELVKLLSESKTAQQIADETGRNRRTVEAQIFAARRKYGVAGNAGLVLIFCRNGLI